ncbi:FMN-binding negative transcriptional regulator [Comamonas thiooxydans]|uniref:FMN-binding negative transcriptional regulator n=1 Tax=Comamonas thiooxydans TaxID=363952 RepID=UPI000A2D51B7|nr:FMN-binding negative transcriptional regulator [Comamonas thiooxydans]BDR08180.1 FMN-binding negative transcriptional regulator [Comamonas thiooxydans]
MYIQPLFAISEVSELQKVMKSYPLATLIAEGAGEVEINLLPLLLVKAGSLGRLTGHVSKSHSLYSKGRSIKTVTAIFQSPNAYISPKWYVNGQRSGRNAPSWNYMAVQAQGRIRFIDDALWMREHLDALTLSQEELREEPWSPTQADPEFLGAVAAGLIGFEVDIENLCGKRFLSQQRTAADRDNLIQHLAQDRGPGAAAVSRLIKS